MLDQLLPRHVDNTYRGYKLSLWLFGLLLFMKMTMGFNCIFNGYSAATSADGIPLETFTPACAQLVVTDFAIWGLSQLVFCLLGILVLVRYRSLIPLMFALLLLEHVGRRLILYFLPAVKKTGTPPGFAVNLILLALMIVGLALSLRSRGNLQTQE